MKRLAVLFVSGLIGLLLLTAFKKEMRTFLASVPVNLGGSTADWVPILVGPKFDPPDDTQAGRTDTDLVGDINNPMLYTHYYDGGTAGELNNADDVVSFRFRLGASGSNKVADFNIFSLVGFDANSDGALDGFMIFDGGANPKRAEIVNPGTDLNISPSTSDFVYVRNTPGPYVSNLYSLNYVSASTDPTATSNDLDVDGKQDVFVSYSFNFTDLQTYLSVEQGINITINTPIRYMAVTATQANSLNGDFGGYNGNTGDDTITFQNQGSFSDTMSVSDPVSAEPTTDVALTKTVDKSRIAETDTVTFQITSAITGNQDASGLQVTDQLPTGFTYVAHTLTNGTYTSGTGIWDLGAQVVGTSDTLWIQAEADVGTNNSIITNTAAVTSTVPDDPNTGNNSASVDVIIGRFSLTGTVFEDMNYAGGDGRPQSATGTAVVQGATVELYNQSTGNFVNSAVTDASGVFLFEEVPVGNYYVRTVSGTVTSQRTGSDGSEIPVPTFTTTTTSGTVTDVLNKVGGENPNLVDAGANGTSATFAGLPGAGQTMQSVASINLTSENLTGVDFGFNFNTVVNTNDGGQGSLRQAILNTNLLQNTEIAQTGLDANVDHILFSIPTTDPNFNSQIFNIALSSGLPAITDAATTVLGNTQQLRTGDTFAAEAEVTNGAEIQISGSTGAVFTISASTTKINDITITASTGAGTNGTAVHFPDATSTGSELNNLTIFGNDAHGVYAASTAENITITNAIIRNNGAQETTASGIFLTGTTNITIQNGFILNNSGEGITLDGGSTGSTISGNTIKQNGTGNTTNTAGIAIRNGSTNSISQNTITGNDGDGVLVISGIQNTITQNSISGNGELGIDLGTGSNGDGVTLNDSGDGDAGPNNLLNYPIIEEAVIDGGNITLTGFASAGATVEVFVSDEDASEFGEGQTYLFTFTEGGAQDNDATTGSYSGAINGIDQGTENAEKYEVTVSLPGGVTANSFLSATFTDATGNTSEFSGQVPVTATGVLVNGFVYLDENHNKAKDGNESGTGLTIYAKLIESNTVTDVVAVNTTTGLYEFSSVVPATYSIVFDDNNSTADQAPNRPAEYVSTETSGFQFSNITVGTENRLNLNAGLYHGAKISGQVFLDTGDGGGTANNGFRDGTEPFIGSVKMQARNGGSLLDEVNTNADGEFTLWIPHSANGSSITIQETNDGRYPVSTGATLGTTGGAYNRATDEITFTVSSGQSYSGVQFGDAGIPTLVGNIDRNAEKGTVVFIPHTFTAPSTGNVTFSVTNTASPANGGWTQLMYEDTNANGELDPGEAQVSGPIAVTKGQEIALVVKVSVPSTGAVGGKNTIVIEGDMSYSNAAPALNRVVSVTDVITINEAGSAGLELVKAVDQANALPGATLVYTITYKNKGSEAITSVVINDSTPPYTNFVSASHQTLPDGVNAITITNPNAGQSGTITWTFDGELRSGATGTIQYTVQIDN